MRFRDEAPTLAVVVVNGLPRGARVEWQIVQCQKSSDEEQLGKIRVAFQDHQVITAVNDLRGDDNVLCLVYGAGDFKRVRSRFPGTVFQCIPSRAVYAVTHDRLERHSSCTIIISG
jgi:hypothetical protein